MAVGNSSLFFLFGGMEEICLDLFRFFFYHGAMLCRCVLLALSLFLVVGWACDPQLCGYPNLTQPGYLAEQQHRAKQFDPFASPEMGPKIVGDRPVGALDATPSYQRRAQTAK